MSMKRMCDRCPTEIPPAEDFDTVEVFRTSEEIKSPVYQRLELCNECLIDFTEWAKRK